MQKLKIHNEGKVYFILAIITTIVTLFFSGPIDSRVLFLERFSPLGMSFVTSAIIGIIFCGVFGGLLELLLFRPLRKAEVGNIAVLVVTIGLSIFIRHLYLLFATGRVQNFPLDLERRQTYLFFEMTPRNFKVLIAGLIVMIVIGLFLTFTRIFPPLVNSPNNNCSYGKK